jgi:hypothetical protein
MPSSSAVQWSSNWQGYLTRFSSQTSLITNAGYGACDAANYGVVHNVDIVAHDIGSAAGNSDSAAYNNGPDNRPVADDIADNMDHNIPGHDKNNNPDCNRPAAHRS